MKHEMFIIKNGGRFHGPFRDFETDLFAYGLRGEVDVLPLLLPEIPDEGPIPTKVEVLDAESYRAQLDSCKVDTHLILSGITQEFWLARRDRRVLTAKELNVLWESLFEVSRAVESLMHHVDLVIADQSSENLDALRKAFWRNRNSDDVDPHYENRFW